MVVINTTPSTDPKTSALWLSAVLAADKGIPSEVTPHGDGFAVVADDGRAIVFTQAQE
jgi:hypothetical protein